jgi:hypothetical protein
MNNFLPWANQFLNKYLTHQSKSTDLYRAALFAIRKLTHKVADWQVEHLDHVFPFKDFLVQYVCSYYVDVGDLIREQPELTQMVSPILSTLTTLLPLRPLRLSDKHDRSIEVTALLLCIVVDGYQIVCNASQKFFSTLLGCNPSLTIFMAIVTQIFPGLLRYPQWFNICVLMRFITARWSTLNVQLNSDLLSNMVNQMPTLIASVLPLLVQEEVAQMAVEIIFGITSLHSAIRNQILSLPKAIRPVMPSTEGLAGESLTEAIASFLSRFFMASQVFDMIMALITILTTEKPLELHDLGLTIAIKYLLKERGNEDFRYDSKIVQSLIRYAHDKSDAIVDQIMQIFAILLSMRLFSLLSVFVTQNQALSDASFSKLMDVILRTENGGPQMLAVISAAFANDDQESTVGFCIRALPMLVDYIPGIDDEPWTVLLLGTVQRVNSVNDPLLRVLLGNEHFETFLEFAEVTVAKRFMSLPLILAALPETPSVFLVHAALALAARSEETCSTFLEYAVSALRMDPLESAFEIMKVILSDVKFECWRSVSDLLATVFVSNMQNDQKIAECCVVFVNKCDGPARYGFWSGVVTAAAENLTRWKAQIEFLVAQCEVIWEPFTPILPSIAIRYGQEPWAGVLAAIGGKLGVSVDSGGIELAVAILKAQPFVDVRSGFLEAFVGMMNQSVSVVECGRIIERLCDDVSEENSAAITAVISHLPPPKSEFHSGVIDALLRLLE